MASSPSRRALLGAFAAVPLAVGVIAFPAVSAVPDTRNWRYAVQLEVSRRKAYEIFHEAYVVEPSDRHEALCQSFGPRPFTPAQKALLAAIDCHEDQYNTLVWAHSDAVQALMMTPAPDIAALALKLDLFAKDESWECVAVGEFIAAMQADAVRLSQGAA